MMLLPAALVVSALLFPAMAYAQAAEVAIQPGLYQVIGKAPDGKPYNGMAAIREMGEGYAVKWCMDAPHEGFGAVQGRQFTVDWGDAAPAIYSVLPNDKLEGTWANGKATETLVLKQSGENLDCEKKGNSLKY